MGEDQAFLLLVGLGEQLDSGCYAPAADASSKIAAVVALIAQGGKYASMLGFDVTVLSAPFFTVDITCRIQVQSGYTALTAKNNIYAALQDLFSVALTDRAPNPYMGFGFEFLDADGVVNYTLEWSKIFGVILRAEGVRAIPSSLSGLLLNGAHGSVVVPGLSWPILGTVRVYDEDTGDEIV